MKKILAFILMLCVVGTTTAYAHGGYYDRHDYYGHGYYGHYRHGHHGDGLGVAIGVMGGLLLGSALVSAAAPPPPAVVYEAPPPRICVQDQVITGEWRIREWDGRRVWVPYEYPVTRRVRVPCY